MTDDQINKIIRHMQRAWFEDGIWEIGFGQAFLLVSLYSWLVIWFDLGPRLGLWLPLVQIGVFLLTFGTVRWVVGVLKERFVFPRTGYAAYRRERGSRRLKRVALAAGVSSLVAILVVFLRMNGGLEARMPAVIGLFMGGGMIYLGLYYSIPRFLIVGGLSIVLGMLLAWLRPQVDTGISILMSGFGLLTLAAGGLALWRFVQRNPVAVESELE